MTVYTICQLAWQSSHQRHIRAVAGSGLLCNPRQRGVSGDFVKDLGIEITEQTLTGACPRCRAKYREMQYVAARSDG